MPLLYLGPVSVLTASILMTTVTGNQRLNVISSSQDRDTQIALSKFVNAGCEFTGTDCPLSVLLVILELHVTRALETADPVPEPCDRPSVDVRSKLSVDVNRLTV